MPMNRIRIAICCIGASHHGKGRPPAACMMRGTVAVRQPLLPEADCGFVFGG
ncbi:hypothetical protein L1S32_09470 [Methanogenium sp. S4BF]|uniref:hypothetical protein n=1 Tax=Methanogenium sp. S4BF TaxID=1789226 RepID=UPI002416923A|nr:hypothetical protein [Methanogenium sp. S4BF]WFN34070.1 hypothetical protein L1S32_09470 [Methanogenium sp. S4BF]